MLINMVNYIPFAADEHMQHADFVQYVKLV